MKIAKAKHELMTDISNVLMTRDICPGVQSGGYVSGGWELKQLERIARTCYKSEDKMNGIDSAEKLVRHLIEHGHEAMLEHLSLTVRFICDRAVSHELVRHRMASFAQESQRYCNYGKDQFEGNITFIQPWWMDEEDDVGFDTWKKACLQAEKAYFDLLTLGYLPQQARMVLPNCTKTEVVVTANYREWRHILKLRCAPDAHPDMQHLMGGLLKELREKIPVVFDDIPYMEVRRHALSTGNA